MTSLVRCILLGVSRCAYQFSKREKSEEEKIQSRDYHMQIIAGSSKRSLHCNQFILFATPIAELPLTFYERKFQINNLCVYI